MPNTYYQMYIQTVFAVKRRNALLEKAWRPQMLAVIGNLINEAGGRTHIVNGIEDRVHCFFSTKPSLNVSDMIQAAKGKSSKWLNKQGLLADRLEWQEAFSCFTYSHSQKDAVYRYIANQEAHHQGTVLF